MKNQRCDMCKDEDLIRIPTYKRIWHLCRQCGSGQPEQRKWYPLQFLPYDDLKKQTHLAPEKMYDYFTTDVHIQCAEQEAKEFHEKYILPNGFDFSGKRIMDISGGNGHFLKTYKDMGADVVLTEINSKALSYAKEKLGFTDVFRFDLNSDQLPRLTDAKFDVIMARACVMFCDDLPDFARQCRAVLNDGGLVIVDRSTEPTLGTLVRVQLDEFSYHYLRQPEAVIDEFCRQGFVLSRRYNEVDDSLYVYDHDILPHWRIVHYLYEIRGATILRNERLFSFPARDRRRSTLFFELH
jgi:ubiquinone/menaquinone biosynthesis C-methylase UbiE